MLVSNSNFTAWKTKSHNFDDIVTFLTFRSSLLHIQRYNKNRTVWLSEQNSL